MSVEPKDWLNVRTAVSRATRFPTLNHLYATVSGNPDLKPEQAVKLEIGCDVFLPHGFSLSGTYFVNDVDDLIDRVDRDSLYENIAEVLLTGVESGVGFTSDFGFSGSINHTYLDACEKDPEVRRYHLPRNKTDYTLSYRSDLGFEVNHTGQYVADRVDADQNPMRDYYLANLKVSYRIRPCLKLFVNIRNVLDKDYEEERNYPRPGRRFFVGIESRF